jgi:hypothetical protein
MNNKYQLVVYGETASDDMILNIAARDFKFQYKFKGCIISTLIPIRQPAERELLAICSKNSYLYTHTQPAWPAKLNPAPAAAFERYTK